MEITLLIKIFIALIILLAILIFFLLRVAKAKKRKLKNEKIKKNLKEEVTLTSLRDKFKNKDLSTKEIKEITELIIKDFGIIKDFKIYVDIILRMTRHPNMNKEILIKFDKELSRLNPKHAFAIGNNVIAGLNSRS